MSRADVARQHEGGRAVRPTLEDVRAARFLTNRVQVQSLNQTQHVILVRRVADANLQPFGLWPAKSGTTLRRNVADNFKFAAQNSFTPKLFESAAILTSAPRKHDGGAEVRD
jgi:hypothetical protein